MVFVFLSVKVAPSFENLTDALFKCRSGLNSCKDGVKRFDFLKKEKNATKQAAQKVISKLSFKSIVVKMPDSILGVMGNVRVFQRLGLF